MSDYQLLLDGPAEATSRLKIAQLGDFKHPRYGDFSVTANDVTAWQKNLSALPGGRALIDIDHRADRSPRNTEAAGWITHIDLSNGEAIADVEWTPLGRKAIEDRSFLFFSPSFGKFTDEQGTVYENTLHGGALTNKPHFTRMPTISLAAPERMVEAFELMYDDEAVRNFDVSAAARKQAAADGNALDDGSYPIRNATELHSAAVLAASGHGDVKAAKALIRKRAGELGVSLSHLPGFSDDQSDTRKKMASVTENALKLLDLEDTATDEDVESAVQKLLDKATEPTPPAAEPAPEVKTLEAELEQRDQRVKTLETQVGTLTLHMQEQATEIAERKFTEAFDQALRTGRAVAGMRDSQHHFFTLDADATIKALNEGPQIVNVVPSRWRNEDTNDPAPQGPPNVAPGNFQLDSAIKKHMADNQIPGENYPKILDDALSGKLNLGTGV